jgi:hypothetical protein
MADHMMMKADGNVVMIGCGTEGPRAYAMFRIYMPLSDELFYFVRLYNAQTEGGIHLPGGNASKERETKTEAYNKLGDALRRCEEWLRPAVVVPEMVMQ